MRKAIVLILALSLVGALVGTAAAKKRKKPAPPVTFEATGTIVGADPVDASVLGQPTSVTMRDFRSSCEVPATQGVDAYVVELSDDISRVPAAVTLEWPNPTGYDLHMYSFDADCNLTGNVGEYEWGDGGVDEGEFDAGTRYVVVITRIGALVDFTITATEIR